MIIQVMYCKYIRKDKTYNCCTIDTDREIYCDDPEAIWFEDAGAYVEANISGDVNKVRRSASTLGYKCVDYQTFNEKWKKEKTA